jgi:hypothetical protein
MQYRSGKRSIIAIILSVVTGIVFLAILITPIILLALAGVALLEWYERRQARKNSWVLGKDGKKINLYDDKEMKNGQ